jgi:hypothetical protein
MTTVASVVADTADGAVWLRVVGDGRTGSASGARDVDGLLSGPQTGDALAVAALGSSAP